MESAPCKRCLLCGHEVPANAVKCPACGKGRFEVQKRPSTAAGGAGLARGAPVRGRAGESPRPAASARALGAAAGRPAPPRRGLLARLRGFLTGGR